ncbi:tetratricopeptide repeat protein [Prosthecobacter sp. SYSU 5D2]|uniref:tetratricopeptide repeat protein n=1 Tax=Prosthecobacter sp. SYSU 5D2 TaxID=3134134 RepID=UPI0031FEF2FF
MSASPLSLLILAAAAIAGLTAWSAYFPAAPATRAPAPPDEISLPPAVTPRTALPDAMALLEIIPPSSPDSKTDLLLQERQILTARHPTRAELWVQLGDALAQKQRETQLPVWHDRAEAAYQKAQQIEPATVAALNGLAWVYGSRHDFQESVRWAKLALDLDPANPISHGIMGDAALELGDLERAAESYQAMLDARPDMSSYSRAAYLVWMKGDVKKGRWLMQKAIDAGSPHPENVAWCRTRLAMMLFNEGALLPAGQVVAEGLKQTPDHVPLLLLLGKIKLAQRDEKAATAAFESVLKSGENHDALVGLGDLHLIHGRTDLAESFFTRLEKQHRLNAAQGIHDHTQMARFYADHDRELDRALQFAQEHAQTQNVYEADTLAWVCYQKGDLKLARKAIETALRAGTPDAEIFYHAGLIAAALNDRPGAQKLLSRALSLNPHFHPLHSTKALKKLDELARTLTVKN